LKIFNSIASFSSPKKTIITIGTFDGVHIGHSKVLHKIVEEAGNNDCESLVLTFAAHPRSILEKEFNLKLLNTTKEKIELLQKQNINNLIIQDFDSSFSELSGEEFAKEILAEKLNAKKIIIGYDHRFGKNRQSSIDDLIVFGQKFGFEVEQISAEEIDEIKVSSTKIRNAIYAGDIRLANQYLGYAYFFSGLVTTGKQLGRTIGFPTANIQIDSLEKITPKKGVYIVTGYWNGTSHEGMMNIGTRPTVDGNTLTIEVHFLNIEENLYDKNITISVLDFIREEMKFEGLASLKNQIEKDKNTTLNYFNHSQN